LDKVRQSVRWPVFHIVIERQPLAGLATFDVCDDLETSRRT
jgi:hypothetical protein